MTKKIAIITHYWKKSMGGGVRNYLVGLVKELQRQKIPTMVIFEKGIDEKNYHINGSRFLFPFKTLLLLMKKRPRVVHSHNTWYCLLSGYIYKFFFKKKLIHTFHSFPLEKTSIIEHFLFQHLLNKCDCVTFVSKDLKTQIQNKKKLTFKNSEITPPGVSIKKFTNDEILNFSNQFDLLRHNPILLTQGFMANRFKADGAKELMRAVKVLRKSYPDILLMLTGEGIFSDELKEFSLNQGLQNNTLFTGNVKNPFIPLDVCDIYTHISMAEGLPLAVLEAMVIGKPIIATRIGGIPEAITNGTNGILVGPYVKDIMQAIETLLKNKDFAKDMGKNAEKTALKQFNWKNSALNFIKIYQNDL